MTTANVHELVQGNELAEVDRMVLEGQELGRRGVWMIAEGLHLAHGTDAHHQAGYTNLGDFAQERYGIKGSRASQLVGMVRLREMIQEHPDEQITWIPENERQARPLTRLLGTRLEEKIIEIIQWIQDVHKGNITGKTLESWIQDQYLRPGKAKREKAAASREKASYKQFAKACTTIVEFLEEHEFGQIIDNYGAPEDVLQCRDTLSAFIKETSIDDLPF